MLSKYAVRASIASTSRKSSLSVVTVSECQVRPPSSVRRIVLPLPLAQATLSFTALTPRSVAVPPLDCCVQRGAAMSDVSASARHARNNGMRIERPRLAFGRRVESDRYTIPSMRRTRASARWMRFALACGLALALAVVAGAAQRDTILTNGRNLQIPINHGLPDKPLGFTFCRLRYQNIRRARKSGWGDDYPQADYNFL